MESILKKDEKALSASCKLEDLYGIWSDDDDWRGLHLCNFVITQIRKETIKILSKVVNISFFVYVCRK